MERQQNWAMGVSRKFVSTFHVGFWRIRWPKMGTLVLKLGWKSAIPHFYVSMATILNFSEFWWIAMQRSTFPENFKFLGLTVSPQSREWQILWSTNGAYIFLIYIWLSFIHSFSLSIYLYTFLSFLFGYLSFLPSFILYYFSILSYLQILRPLLSTSPSYNMWDVCVCYFLSFIHSLFLSISTYFYLSFLPFFLSFLPSVLNAWAECYTQANRNN